MCSIFDASGSYFVYRNFIFFTQRYLLCGDVQPEYVACVCPLTVQHILIECADFMHIRQKYFSVSSVRELFEKVSPSKIFSFLKEIELFYLI